MLSDIGRINERIKAIRKSLGYTQAKFAAPLGITQGHLTDIERGKKNPSDTLLIALAYRYAVNPLYLYENKGAMFISHGESAEAAAEDRARGIDHDLLKDIIVEVENDLKRRGVELAPEKKAEVISLIYEEIIEDEGKKSSLGEKVIKLIRLAS